MKLEKQSVWIFTILILGVTAVLLIPTAGMIAFGLLALPVLIAVQAVLILRSKNTSDKKFDDEWYDRE